MRRTAYRQIYTYIQRPGSPGSSFLTDIPLSKGTTTGKSTGRKKVSRDGSEFSGYPAELTANYLKRGRSSSINSRRTDWKNKNVTEVNVQRDTFAIAPVMARQNHSKTSSTSLQVSYLWLDVGSRQNFPTKNFFLPKLSQEKFVQNACDLIHSFSICQSN